MSDAVKSLFDAAVQVLAAAGRPMKVDEIWSEISRRSLYSTRGATPTATLATELLRSTLGQPLASRKRERPFYKAGPSTFGMVEWLQPQEREELQRKEAALDLAESGPVPWHLAVGALRKALERAPGNAEYARIVAARDEVLARYRPVFSVGHLPNLSAQEMREFLIFANNKHWQGLQRLGPLITRDMDALRDALATLFDESKPLDERVDYANARVPKLAQAIITPALMMFDPAQYGVWNRIAESGLKALELMPAKKNRQTLGERYVAINEILQRLAAELGIDLWTLDALWWATFASSDDVNEGLPAAPSRNVWIEITDEQHDHGGAGWELGTCLWSPMRNSADHKRYELLREPKQGDVVIHFATPVEGGQRRIVGTSTVSRPMVEVDDEPPKAGKWADMGPYYRIDLEGFRRFAEPPNVDTLVERGRDLLRSEAESERDYPYTKYGDTVRIAQGRYLARCTPDLYKLVTEALEGAAVRAVTLEVDLAQITRDFAMALREAHISFGQRHELVARNLVCSLAAKRFVILTGLSGSGKTQLAVKFGQWLGGKDRYELVPVRPDWTGPEALLGYEDALLRPSDDGRRAWSVPRTLEFLLRAANDPSNPYLLILDEMNLAHVERYFADVLSGMESDEAIIPDLRDENGVWRPAKRGLRMAFPENVFIVGTINIDETTYMFSPKVLDRANTIEFRVETDDLPTDPTIARRPDAARSGPPSLVAGFLDIASDDEWQIEHPPEFVDEFVREIRRLHSVLRASGDEFGHRTFFEGIRLASLLAQASDATCEQALDVFVLQKVLPRLHGARRKLEPVLKALGRFCVGDDVNDDDPYAADSEPRLPFAFAKARRMFNSLRANQFASFSD